MDINTKYMNINTMHIYGVNIYIHAYMVQIDNIFFNFYDLKLCIF